MPHSDASRAPLTLFLVSGLVAFGCAGRQQIPPVTNHTQQVEVTGGPLSAADDPVSAADAKLAVECTTGDAFACFILGRRTVRGESNRPYEMRRGLDLLYRACELGHGDSCGIVALFLQMLNKSQEHDTHAMDLLARGCAQGTLLSCLFLGNAYEQGQGVAQDPQRAASLYASVCEQKESRGCTALALLKWNQAESEEDRASAAERFVQACRLGSGDACVWIPKAYAEANLRSDEDNELARDLLVFGCSTDHAGSCLMAARKILADASRSEAEAEVASFDDSTAVARELLRKACDLGSPDACYELATTLKPAEGKVDTLLRALQLFEERCKEGEPRACMGVGRILQREGSSRAELSRAAALYARACDAQVFEACGRLGMMYHRGQGVTVNHGRSVDLLRQSCHRGDAGACGTLGDLYERGDGVFKNLKEAGAWYRAACEQGSQRGCDQVRRLEKGR